MSEHNPITYNGMPLFSEPEEECHFIRLKSSELLPPIIGIKDSSLARLAKTDIEWIPVTNLEVKPDG